MHNCAFGFLSIQVLWICLIRFRFSFFPSQELKKEKSLGLALLEFSADLTMEKFKHDGLQSFSKANKTKASLLGSCTSYRASILSLSFSLPSFFFVSFPPPHILQKHVSHMYTWNSTDYSPLISVKCQ